jgi:hypothetical protein
MHIFEDNVNYLYLRQTFYFSNSDFDLGHTGTGIIRDTPPCHGEHLCQDFY